MNSKVGIKFRSFTRLGRWVAALLLLPILLANTACGRGFFEQSGRYSSASSKAFEFNLPQTTTATQQQPEAAATIGGEQPSAQPAQDLTTAPATAEPLNPSQLPAETISGGNKIQSPLFAKPQGAEDINFEPLVPLSVPGAQPIRGISGHRVERFFKTLSTNPVYYHYVLHPVDGASASDEAKYISEVMLALSDDKSYMRVDTLTSAVVLLQTDSTHLYQIDLISGKAESLPPAEGESADLSFYAFQQLEKNAAFFIFTGKGEANFFGRSVQFEEYTIDGLEFIRYYFIGDVLLGHRSFKDGKILQTVEVKEASNKLDPLLFQFPENIAQPSTSELETLPGEP